jgi:large subunit ribosomal protein L9
MATQVILLERIETLGNMGDVVSVKPGYARNFLLPQKKALRASKENIAYFEAKRKHLESENAKGKAEAEKQAKKLEGLIVSLVRQASEGGQLFGSVNSRDIAEQIAAEAKETIARSQIQLNQNFKTVGLFPVFVVLHPEVKVEIIVNIARSVEEAAIQKKTGKASAGSSVNEEQAVEEANLESVLDDEVLEAKKQEEAAAE